MEVQITNPFYLRHLEKLRSDFFDTEGYHDEEFYTIHQDYDNGEYYCSPEYLNVMRLKNHDGYPDAGFCQPLSKMATVDHRNIKKSCFDNKLRYCFVIMLDISKFF